MPAAARDGRGRADGGRRLHGGRVGGAARTQGIAEREFAELVRAMRAGVTYANVHSDRWPGGEIRGQFDHEQGHQDD